MKTTLFFKQLFLQTTLLIGLSAVNAQSGTGGGSSTGTGLKFDNYQRTSGTDLQVGAKYLFQNVDNNVDAEISVDSLVNGAKLNKIDDNSNGTGYKEAFQPAVQSGSVAGLSYVVFTVRFFQHGSTTPAILPIVNATALDLDGNNTLKEYARVNIGSNGTMNYMIATPDISINQVASGDFTVQNILGVERSGIDTSSLANMFTASNTNISSFTIKYGTITSNTSSSVRQFSLYMKWFNYPSTLPVKLSSFSATLSNTNKVDLKWSTATETNLSHFIVERSTDGANYSDAGMVFAYGNTTSKVDYALADNISSIQSGVIYYRLRSVDVDGKNQYSDVRIIRIGKQSDNNITILAYPNPVSNEIRITIPANWQNKKVVYEVFSLAGQTAKKIQSANSSQTETLNVSNLNSGMYIVKVTCEGQTAQQKIVKQ